MALTPSLEIFEGAINTFYSFFSGGIAPGVIMILAVMIIVMLIARFSPEFVVMIMIPLISTVVVAGFGLPTWVFVITLILSAIGFAVSFFLKILR